MAHPDQAGARDAAGGATEALGASERLSSWSRYGHVIALLTLAVVTGYGAWSFATSDMSAALETWRGAFWVLPPVLALGALDIAVEGVAWTWVYTRFGIRVRDRAGAAAYLASRSGLLLPAQLGRLVRPDAIVRLGRGSMVECLKAEAVTFVLDAFSVCALLAGLLAFTVHWALAPLAALVTIGGALLVGGRAAAIVARGPLELPAGFWLRPATVAIVLIQMSGWLVHGFALYVLIAQLPGEITLWDPLFYAATSSVLGVGSGLPGGVGATEGLLGAALGMMKIPAEHLAFAVGGFRLATFWIWIPIGWLALGYVQRVAQRRNA